MTEHHAEKVFDAGRIWLDETYMNQADLFESISSRLNEMDFVKLSFGAALTEREIKFPTGIQTEFDGIAIPHTDAIHVIAPCISFVRLRTPMMFRHMGMEEVEVQVRYVFILAVKNPEDHVNVLGRLVELFTNHAFMEKISETKYSKDAATLLNQYYNEISENSHKSIL
jgi:PTS system galactitol-specific IIA component